MFADTGTHGAVSLDEAWSLVRPLLEEYLRFRFPLYWKPQQWLGDFLALAKDVKSAPHPLPLTAGQIAQIDSFKSRSNNPHHGGGPQPVNPPSETEMIALANEVLAFVRQS